MLWTGGEGLQPYIDHYTTSCPRRQNTTEDGHKCQRKCRTDLNCNHNRNRKCVCAGVCGMSCIRTRRKSLKDNIIYFLTYLLIITSSGGQGRIEDFKLGHVK